MAVRTSRASGGGFSRISPAPSYGNVISRYSNEIRTALQQEAQAELDTNILAYRAGSLKWEDLRNYLEKKILSLDDGTTQKVKLQTQLVDLSNEENIRQKNLARAKLEAQKAEQGITPKERYDIEKSLLAYETPGTKEYVAQQSKVIDAFEDSEAQKVIQRREELLRKYESGGITDQEELAIVKELKTIANPDSKIFTQLQAQEQGILQKLDTAGKEAGKTSLTNTSRDKLAEIIAAERQSDINYQQGKTTGFDRDAARMQNAREAYEVLQHMADAGISVPLELLSEARKNFDDATMLVKLRQGGQLFDVVDRNGELKPVTIDGRDPFTGKDVDYKNYPYRLNPTTNLYEVYDPSTDQVIKRVRSEKAAKEYAEQAGLVTFDTLISDNAGRVTRKTLGQDAATGAYYNAQRPNEIYLKIPQTSKDASSYVLTNLPSNWKQDPTKVESVKGLVQTINGGLQEGQSILDYNNYLTGIKDQPKQEQAKSQPGGKSFTDGLGNFLGSIAQNFTQPVTQPKGGLVQDFVQSAPVKAATSTLGGINPLNMAADLGVKTGNAASSYLSDLKFPSFDLGNFSLPSLPSFNDIKLPSFSSPTSRTSTSSNSNIPNLDFLGGITRLGMNAGSSLRDTVSNTASNLFSSIGNTASNLFGKAKGLFGF